MTPEQLGTICPALPQARLASWAEWLNAAMARFGIDSPRRQAAFVSQLAHESQQFTRLQEGLNYTSEERLQQIYGRRFWRAGRDPKDFVRQPERLANFVYASRLGNGDEASGDGWRYRGRGPIQITGRKNYRMAGDAIGVDYEATPDLVLDPKHGALVAGWYWYVTGCNALADAFDFVGITERINGPALAGLEDRQQFWIAARGELGDGMTFT